jgi:hypothetical protein
MGFLEFGGVIFYLFLATAFITIIVSLETKDKANLGWPVAFTLGFLIAAYFVFKIHWSYDYSVYQTLTGALVFIVIGILWSFFKWLKYVKVCYKMYLREVARSGSANISFYTPQAFQNKAQISSWIIFWPFSIIRYAFVSLLSDVMNALINRLSVVFNRITKSQFKEVDKSEAEYKLERLK